VGQWYLTPAYVLDRVRSDLGGIDLDPCTEPDNPTRARRFYTAKDDGLALTWWQASSVFCNPPYGKAREPWVNNCVDAARIGVRVILLIPAATDTRIFRRAAESCDEIVFIQGRVKFGTLRMNRRQHAASHPSALLGWNVTLAACAALGWRVRLGGEATGYRDAEINRTLPAESLSGNWCKRPELRLCELCEEPLRAEDERAHPWCQERLRDQQQWEDAR